LIQTGHEYINGSTARALEYNVYEENEVLKAKKQYKNNRKAKARVVISVLTVLVAGLVVMYRFALITQLNYNIYKSEKQYYDIRNENMQMRAQVEKDTDLASIKEIAETRLAMQKPDKSQVVYIKVPRNDYTVVMNVQDDVEQLDGNTFSLLIDKIAGFINLLN
jgi:cell division protein FtsL